MGSEMCIRDRWVTDRLKEEAVSGSDTSRVSALTQLGRSIGMFSDNVTTEEKSDRSASEIEADLQRRLALLMGE